MPPVRHLRAFLLADVDIGQDLLHLIVRGLGADHGGRVERVALLDGRDALDGALDELVVDRFLDQRAAGAGADFALVEGEQREAFERLVEEFVVGVHHVGEEDVRRFAAQLQRRRDQVVGGVMGDHAAGGGRAGEGDLGDALALAQSLAGLGAEAADDVQHAGRQQVGDQFGENQNADRGLFGGLHHDAVAGGDRRGELPGGHQQREVPGNDLADHAERLMVMIGDGVVVDLRDAAFLGAQAAGEIAEMIGHQRNVGIGRLADRLAVVERFDQREGGRLASMRSAIFSNTLERSVGGGAAPGVLGGVGGVEGEFDVFSGGAGDLDKEPCR